MALIPFFNYLEVKNRFLLSKLSILENLMKKLCDANAGAHTCKHTNKNSTTVSLYKSWLVASVHQLVASVPNVLKTHLERVSILRKTGSHLFTDSLREFQNLINTND